MKKFGIIFALISLIIISSPSLAWTKHKVVGPARGKISSGFGYRNDPFSAQWTFHAGLDIAADQGEPIYALQDGVVSYSGWCGGYGLCVVIDHYYSDIPEIPRIETKFGHNSKDLVKKGDYVRRGEIIAYIGSTGRSTGPHLHFEVRFKGYPVDPMQYMTKLPQYLDYVAYVRERNRYTSSLPARGNY